ncbi:MAG: GGDEF domain-containing protein [Syntrophomonas sp.]
MKANDKYDISFSGEFVDKALEREFLHYDMKYYLKIIGPVAIIFGLIFMTFIISDYFAIESHSSFTVIFLTRLFFLMVSIVLYFAVKKINDYSNLVYLITTYEIVFFVSFIVIINQYGSISIMSFFSIMAITLAVYIIPNRLINSQIISVLFALSFFIFYYNHIEHMETSMLLELVGYSLIFITFGNIQAYLTNFYRRKQFADSRELLRLSVTDSLTGIYNKAKFNQELDWWIDFCNRYGSPLSLVIFDIDNFKKINDNYGHLTGDNILKSITLLIKNTIRNTDIFARWGGDEFVVLLPNTDIEQAIVITERMRSCIQKSKCDGVINVTCSFGLVSLLNNENTESLLQRADKFLYKAKEQGKNTVAYEVGKGGEQIKASTYVKSI